MNTFRIAINLAGSQSRLARIIGVKPQNVQKWAQTKVSPDFVIKVSEAVEYKVTPHELRPDLYPHPQDGLPAHLREARAA